MSSPSTRRIPLSDIAATPWKNGGGITREIAAGPPPGAGAGWGWRVSLAEVARDGPFSLFPDTDRVIAVIDGPGMDLLRPDGSRLALEPFAPLRFAGEEALDGRLREGRAVRDLNVMVLRRHFTAAMEIRDGPCALAGEPGDGGCLLVHNLAGGCRVQVDARDSHDLAPAETLVHEGRGRLDIRLAEAGRAAVIRIAPR
ncbi:MAG: HutD family protein [Kiloniellaceae bacterium]